MGSLGRDSSRSYLGRSVSVPVSKACLKGGAIGVTHSCEQKSAEVVVPNFEANGNGKDRTFLTRKNHP